MAEHHSVTASRPLSATVGKIRCAHILVKHRDSRRPSSWREAEITRSKEEAISIVQGHEKRIRSKEVTLGDLSKTESDCSSARKKGDLSVSCQHSYERQLIDCTGDSLGKGRCSKRLRM